MRRLLAGSSLILAGLCACNTNHDLLAAHPSGGGSGGVLSDAGPDAAGGGGSGGSAPDAAPDVVEPKGPDRLTLVHGVVDAKRIAFCFASVDSAGKSTLVGSPLPPAGLDFGHAKAVGSLTGLDFAKDAIQPVVIAGDLSLVSGMSCNAAVALATKLSTPDAGPDAASDAAASDAASDAAPDAAASDAGAASDASAKDAGTDASGDAAADAPSDAGSDVTDAAVDAPPPVAPPLRAEALPVLPAGTLTGGRSYLLVAAGCMGAPGFSDSLDQAVCGVGYAPDQPTLTPVLVRMSRLTKPDKLGLQVVNASRGTDSLTLQSGTPPNTTHNPLTLASSVGFGAILPRPPDLARQLAAYGVPLGTVPLQAYSGAALALTQKWSAALSLGGLSKLQNGQTYALIAVGPRIDIATPGWWNAPVIGIVPTAP